MDRGREGGRELSVWDLQKSSMKQKAAMTGDTVRPQNNAKTSSDSCWLTNRTELPSTIEHLDSTCTERYMGLEK